MIPLKYAALLALVVQTTSAVILTRYSKIFQPPGTLPYYSTSLVVMSEFTKLVASLLLVFYVDITDSASLNHRVDSFRELIYRENFASPRDTIKLAIPAALYTLQNNLIYVALSNLEPTTFQVGYQMKVITTAVLSVIILSRSLTWLKWGAIFLLALGIILTQIEGGGKDKAMATSDDEQSFTIGIFSVIVCGCSSALAGVYFEKILKGTPTTVWMRNSQLAFFSCIFGMCGCIFVDGVFKSFFQGYYSMVWMIIAVQAIGGLIVAVVVKYADNILKGFATAISIVVCGLTSAWLFHFAPTPLFYFGSMLVIFATMLYSLPDTAGPCSAAQPLPASPASNSAAAASAQLGDHHKHDEENMKKMEGGSNNNDSSSSSSSSSSSEKATLVEKREKTEKDCE